MDNSQQKPTALDKYLKGRTNEITNALVDGCLDDKNGIKTLDKLINDMATSETLLMGLIEISTNDHRWHESYMNKYENDIRKVLNLYATNYLSNSKAFKAFKSHVDKILK